MSKNKKNRIYLQFLLALVRRRLDILDPSKEDVVPAKQLLQLQPLLDLLSQDLENVGRGCGASSHIPSGESSWSTLPWFVQVLRRTSTSQKMLAWTVRQVWQAGVRVPRVHHLVLFQPWHSPLSKWGEKVFDSWQVVVVHLLVGAALEKLLLLRLHRGHHLCVVGVVEEWVGDPTLSLAQPRQALQHLHLQQLGSHTLLFINISWWRIWTLGSLAQVPWLERCGCALPW